MSLRLLTSVLLASLIGCGSGDPPPTPGAPPPAVDVLQTTWPLQAALDESLDARVLGAVAGRWLGGQGSWGAPGSAHDSLPPLLRARMLSEDARALTHVAWVVQHAACRLAQEPTSFDTSLPEGFAVGARSCEALADGDGAAIAARNLDALGVPAPAAVEGSGPQVAVVERSLEILGESLRYVFVEPAELSRAATAIGGDSAQKLAAAGPTLSVADSFSLLAGTGSLSSGAALDPSLPHSKALWDALPAEGRQSAAESALDRAVARISAGLTQLPTEGAGALDAAGRALLEGWVQRALYRDLGLWALDANEPGLALVLLEEAAGSSARHRPAAGLDPLLLAGLARARYASNELRRAVDLLEDMGAAPGWSLCSHAARTVARVAVLPSAAEPQVNR